MYIGYNYCMSIWYLHYNKFYILWAVLTMYGLTERIINEWMNKWINGRCMHICARKLKLCKTRSRKILPGYKFWSLCHQDSFRYEKCIIYFQHNLFTGWKRFHFSTIIIIMLVKCIICVSLFHSLNVWHFVSDKFLRL